MSHLPHAKKSLGQHWLTDTATLDAIIECAAVRTGDYVLEIGPGTGTLTDRLLAAGAEVLALEIDEARLATLNKQYQEYDSSRIFIQEGDIRTYDFTYLPETYKIVANIPYYLTANLLRRLVDEEPKPQVAALLVQKEVAERVVAQAGNLSPIGIFVQIYYEAMLGPVVPARMFTPPPKVDSQVLVLSKREQPLVTPSETFFRVVNAGFSEKRKKLRSSLSAGMNISKQDVETWLRKAGIDPHKRAQELTIQEWQVLTLASPIS